MKQKGFVTIACGDERYFKLAVNLLLSYKYHSREILPWAIITDRENKYTAQFDDVVMIPELEKSYMSKIQMLIHPPYKENIFIDADCLVYSDINSYFKYMKPGVSHFGYKIALRIIEDGLMLTILEIGEARYHSKYYLMEVSSFLMTMRLLEEYMTHV